MWMTIGISTLSTKNHLVESFIEVEGTNERFIFNSQKKDFNQIHKINLSNVCKYIKPYSNMLTIGYKFQQLSN